MGPFLKMKLRVSKVGKILSKDQSPIEDSHFSHRYHELQNFPNDGDFDTFEANVTWSTSIFEIKGMKWNLDQITANHRWGKLYENGYVAQSGLDVTSYHHYHTPVSGRVLEVSLLGGTFDNCLYISLPECDFVNRRALVFIENPTIGVVCVIPIGLGSVSSVMITVNPGDYVNKGDEIGHFEIVSFV